MPADFGPLMQLYAQLHPDDPVVDGGRDRRVFDEILLDPNLYLFVLEDTSGQLNATCYMNVIPNLTRNASPYAVIENVVTHERARNQGLGKQVIKHALEMAWQLGCYKVMLQTGSRAAATHNFYEACGFRADEKTAYLARPLNNTEG